MRFDLILFALFVILLSTSGEGSSVRFLSNFAMYIALFGFIISKSNLPSLTFLQILGALFFILGALVFTCSLYSPVIAGVSNRNLLVYGSMIIVCIAVGAALVFIIISSLLYQAASTNKKQQTISNDNYDNGYNTAYVNSIGAPNIHSTMEAQVYQNI